jgi:hypothetical protein
MSETPGDLIQWTALGARKHKGSFGDPETWSMLGKQAKAEVNDGRARKHGVLHALDWLGVKKLEGRANTLKRGKCPRLR